MSSTDYPPVQGNEFSASIAKVIFDIKVSLGSVGIVLCLLAILIIGVIKEYRNDFVHRLLMYFMVVNSLQALCQVLQVIPVEVTSNDLLSLKNGTGWSEVCAVFGFLDMVTSWMSNLVVVWMMLYILKQSCLSNDYQMIEMHRSNSSELVGMCVALLSPFLFSWIPFIKDMYGVSGPWCWIKIMSEKGCNNSNFQHLSLTFMVAMFYGPLFCIMIFVLVCMIATIILQTCADHTLSFQQTKTRILFTYAFIYCCFSIFSMANRIYTFIHFKLMTSDRPAYHPLWIVHAVADSSRILVPALIFLLRVCWTRSAFVLRQRQHQLLPAENAPLIGVDSFCQRSSLAEPDYEGSSSIATLGGDNNGQKNVLTFPTENTPLIGVESCSDLDKSLLDEPDDKESSNICRLGGDNYGQKSFFTCPTENEPLTRVGSRSHLSRPFLAEPDKDGSSNTYIARLGDDDYDPENFPFLFEDIHGTAAQHPPPPQPAEGMPPRGNTACAHMEDNLPGRISSRGDDKEHKKKPNKT